MSDLGPFTGALLLLDANVLSPIRVCCPTKHRGGPAQPHPTTDRPAIRECSNGHDGHDQAIGEPTASPNSQLTSTTGCSPERRPAPFVWHNTADQILERLAGYSTAARSTTSIRTVKAACLYSPPMTYCAARVSTFPLVGQLGHQAACSMDAREMVNFRPPRRRRQADDDQGPERGFRRIVPRVRCASKPRRTSEADHGVGL